MEDHRFRNKVKIYVTGECVIDVYYDVTYLEANHFSNIYFSFRIFSPLLVGIYKIKFHLSKNNWQKRTRDFGEERL